MAWPGNRVQEMVIAKLLLRLSLNNPSNVCHCSKEICHKNDRERERKESERVGCQWIWLSLYNVLCASLTKNSCTTTVVYYHRFPRKNGYHVPKTHRLEPVLTKPIAMEKKLLAPSCQIERQLGGKPLGMISFRQRRMNGVMVVTCFFS